MARTLVGLCVLSLLCAGIAFAAPPGGGGGGNITFVSLEIDGNPIGVKSCGQIGSETEVITVNNGGGGTTHVPGRTTFSNIVCTRGLTTDMTFYNFRHTVEQGNLQRKNGKVLFLDQSFTPIVEVDFSDGWPNSLFIDAVDNSTQNIITETISIVNENQSRH